VGRSPTPSWYPSPSTKAKADDEANDEAEAEADDEADDEAEVDDKANILADAEAKVMAVADILSNTEFESDGSPVYVTMDSKNDRLHGYAMPVLSGLNLFLRVSPYGNLVCPVCPKRKAHGWIEANARAHVLARAHAPLDITYTNDKNVARHPALARNQG
jgi:hypothetical protein